MEIKDKNLYYVGGVVRDELIGYKSIDTDYCYEGNAIEFAKKQGLNIVKENPDFGTVRILEDGKEIDIASTRTEIYPKKGHLPQIIKIGCSLKEDLKRRDFAVNALAKRTTDGEIIDFFEGLKDIKNKKLRILHDESFVDDPTRIIRGLKFSVRFNFELEKTTFESQKKYLENINYDMSYHRLKKELIETFNLNNQIAYDKFVDQMLYKLLGKNVSIPTLKEKIQPNVDENLCIWIMYLGYFDLSNLPLTRKEKSILKWVSKLETQAHTNNTPKESIIMYKVKTGKIL